MRKQEAVAKMMQCSDQVLLEDHGPTGAVESYGVHTNNLRVMLEWMYDRAYEQGQDDSKRFYEERMP